MQHNAISLSSAVDVRIRKAGLTLAGVLLAAWSTLLSERMHDASPVFGLYQLGRSSSFESIDKVHGPLLNCLPIQLRGGSLLDKARAAVSELRLRAKFEQTDLQDAHRWAGLSQHQACYNTFVNILFGDQLDQHLEMHQLDLGHPLDYSHHSQHSTHDRTPPSTPHVALPWQPDVNLDVVLKNHAVDIAIKANTSVVAQADLHTLVNRLVQLVHATLELL